VTDGKAAVRATVFGHLAGMVMAPVVKALWERRALELFKGPGNWIELDRIVEHTHGNRGYLRVALRMLASHGWLIQREDNQNSPSYTLTTEGAIALEFAPRLYGEVVPFLSMAIFLEDFLFGNSQGSVLPWFQVLVPRAKERWISGRDAGSGKIYDQIRAHADGVLVGPAMAALERGGIFKQLREGPVEMKNVPANPIYTPWMFDLLATQGWITLDRDRLRLTQSGLYAANIATAYGVTVSYLPLLAVIGTLLFGNARVPRVDDSGVELFVNRAMNVWGSGGAHKTYFNKLEEIIKDIFSRPLEAQPKGICDMGCGDGTLLEHVYSVVKNQTPRGKVLDAQPLIVVGADINKVARRLSTQRLRRAKIPSFHVISGNISRPAQLANDLEKLELDIHELLHVRSFLDHNRPYAPPADYVRGQRNPRTTGAFAYLGEEIPADEMEENLVRHLRRWAPYTGRFGLLVLELHTLPPEVTALNLDKTPAVAYDATHGFSDQYLVELPVFLELAREAGLVAEPRYQAKFPPSDLATISINYFSAGLQP
jgi:hypothetical protein